MNDLAHKCMGLAGVEVKDADRGMVEAVIGKTGLKDRDRDIFLKGAFGSRGVRVGAYNHRSWPQRGGLPPVGRGTIRENGSEVIASMKFFMGTAEGRDAFEVVKEMGDLQEWSFGWVPGTEKLAQITPELRSMGVRRAIASVPVEEVSPVLVGATFGSRTIGVKECESCGAPIEEDSGEETGKEETPEECGCELKAEAEEEVARFRSIIQQVETA